MAQIPPCSSQARRAEENPGVSLMPKPPYPVRNAGLLPSSLVPLRWRMTRGTLVPSFEVARVWTTSVSEKSAGEISASAVLATLPEARGIGVPGARREVADRVEEEVVLPDLGAQAHAADGWDGNLAERLAGEVEDADAGWTAHHVENVEPRVRGLEPHDDHVRFGHHEGGLRDVGVLHRDAEHLSARRILDGEDVEVVPGAEERPLGLVLEVRHAGPGARGAQKVHRVLPAVTVGHGGQELIPVVAAEQFGLGDARPVLADGVGVLGFGRAEDVVVDLLVEVLVRLGPFPEARVAGVEEALPVLVPGHAAAARPLLHPGDGLVDGFPRGHVVDEQRAVLAAAHREGDGHELGVGGGDVPVDGRDAAGIEGVGIEHHAGRRRVLHGGEGHEEGLLLGRLGLHGEEDAPHQAEAAEARRGAAHEGREPLTEGFPAGQGVEVGAGAGVLRLAPGLHRGVRPVLEPAVVVGHGHAVVGVRHGTLLRGRWAFEAFGGGGAEADGEQEREGGRRDDALHRVSSNGGTMAASVRV